MVGTKVEYCAVCGAEVEVTTDFEGDALCILHYFEDDISEDWERE